MREKLIFVAIAALILVLCAWAWIAVLNYAPAIEL